METIDSRIERPSLNKYDKHVISTILNSQPFRKFVGESIDYNKDRVDAIEHILSILDLIIMMSEKSRPVIEKHDVSLNFEKKEDYDYFIEKIVPNMREIKLDIANLVTMNTKKRAFLDNLNDIAILTVPYKQEKKLRHGVTFIGRFYKQFELLYQGFNDMPDRIDGLMKLPQTNKIKKKLKDRLEND